MQNLKDVMLEDIDDVFLETEEFGEKIVLDSHSILAVVERTDILLRDTVDDRGPVVADSVTLYVRKKDIAYGKYYPEKTCYFNGEKWHVLSCDSEDLVTLVLYKERS